MVPRGSTSAGSLPAACRGADTPARQHSDEQLSVGGEAWLGPRRAPCGPITTHGRHGSSAGGTSRTAPKPRAEARRLAIRHAAPRAPPQGSLACPSASNEPHPCEGDLLISAAPFQGAGRA